MAWVEGLKHRSESLMQHHHFLVAKGETSTRTVEIPNVRCPNGLLAKELGCSWQLREEDGNPWGRSGRRPQEERQEKCQIKKGSLEEARQGLTIRLWVTALPCSHRTIQGLVLKEYEEFLLTTSSPFFCDRSYPSASDNCWCLRPRPMLQARPDVLQSQGPILQTKGGSEKSAERAATRRHTKALHYGWACL